MRFGKQWCRVRCRKQVPARCGHAISTAPIAPIQRSRHDLQQGAAFGRQVSGVVCAAEARQKAASDPTTGEEVVCTDKRARQIARCRQARCFAVRKMNRRRQSVRQARTHPQKKVPPSAGLHRDNGATNSCSSTRRSCVADTQTPQLAAKIGLRGHGARQRQRQSGQVNHDKRSVPRGLDPRRANWPKR